MAIVYDVRIYCEDEETYKRTTQTDTIDETWKPSGCSSHTTRDFVIEALEETA